VCRPVFLSFSETKTKTFWWIVLRIDFKELYTFTRDSHMCVYTDLLVCARLSCICMYKCARVGVIDPFGPLGWYGVASIIRLLKIIGLFCKRAL